MDERKSNLQVDDASRDGGEVQSAQQSKNQEHVSLDTTTAHHPEAKCSNLTMRCHDSTQENICPDSIQIAHQREMVLSLPPSTSLSALEVASDQHNCTIGSGIVPIRSSAAAAGIPSTTGRTEIRSSLNQSLIFPSDFEELSSNNKTNNMAFCHSNQDASAYKNEATDGATALQCRQHTTVLSIAPISETVSTNSLHFIDRVKHPASSSVKSYGSNLGSDDCGGSLDVETHSDDARSIDELFPASMLDQDPEIVAVASLSINPAESNDFNRFADRYSNQGHFTPLSLQRFHHNSVDSHSKKDHVDSAFWQISREDTADAANWYDPRIEKQSANDSRGRRSPTVLTTMEDLAKARRRSRSRSRTPPTQH